MLLELAMSQEDVEVVEDFRRLNETYARHMPEPPPARSAPANVQLPRGLLVSIEAIAVLPGSPS